MTECLAGRTAVSLNSVKGIPARMLTSRCSTIKPVFQLGLEKDRVQLADGGHFYA